MRPDYQLEMESCPTNIRPVLFYDTVVLTGDRLEGITGETVSGNYFSSLGLATTLGRLPTEEDELKDAQVAVLSHSFWQRASKNKSSGVCGS